MRIKKLEPFSLPIFMILMIGISCAPEESKPQGEVNRPVGVQGTPSKGDDSAEPITVSYVVSCDQCKISLTVITADVASLLSEPCPVCGGKKRSAAAIPNGPRSSSIGDTSIVASAKRKIYHHPSCEWASRIETGNTTYFGSCRDAQMAGFRACKLCSPTDKELGAKADERTTLSDQPKLELPEPKTEDNLRVEKFENGEKHFEAEGLVAEDGSWVNHGHYVEWNEFGSKECEGNFVDGKRDGKWKSWSWPGIPPDEEMWADGKKMSVTTLYRNGNKNSTKNYASNGDAVSFEEWHPNGSRKSVTTFINNRRDGKQTFWYSNGQKAAEGENRMGCRIGTWTTWNRLGETLLTESHGKDGAVLERVRTDAQIVTIQEHPQPKQDIAKGFLCGNDSYVAIGRMRQRWRLEYFENEIAIASPGSTSIIQQRPIGAWQFEDTVLGVVLSTAEVRGEDKYIVAVSQGLNRYTGVVDTNLVMPPVQVGSQVVVGDVEGKEFGLIQGQCDCYACENVLPAGCSLQPQERNWPTKRRSALIGTVTEIHWKGLAEGRELPIPVYKIKVSENLIRQSEFGEYVWAYLTHTRIKD